MNTMMPTQPTSRYIVVHYGNRDRYQVAISLAEVGKLEKLFTDYYQPDAMIHANVIIPARIVRMTANRRADHITSKMVDVLSPANALRHLYLRRLEGERKFRANLEMDRNLGIKSGKFAASHNVGAVVYSYYWQGYLEGRGKSRSHSPSVVFLLHPTPLQVRRVLSEDRLRTGNYRQLEEEERMSDREVADFNNALTRADAAIVSSDFVKNGLLELGYPEERIRVVPYGVDENSLITQHPPNADRPKSSSGTPLRLLWIGQITYRKGLHHLVEALTRMPEGSYTLTVVGNAVPDPELVRRLPTGVNFLGRVSSAQLEELIVSHDLFVMPSLIEGFGLVYLEALAGGTPFICTENTGGPDLITANEEGVVIKPGDVDQLEKVLRRAIGDRGWVARMQHGANLSSQKWGWDRFREGIRQALSDLERVLD